MHIVQNALQNKKFIDSEGECDKEKFYHLFYFKGGKFHFHLYDIEKKRFAHVHIPHNSSI